MAIENNDTEAIMDVITNGIQLNIKDSDGDTPLTWAVQNSHIESVTLLISEGAEVDFRDEIYGATPLHWAVKEENVAIPELLIKKVLM